MKQSIAQLIEEDYLVKPQTGKIILNGTGIEIDLPENVMFIDHGIILSLYFHQHQQIVFFDCFGA